MSLFYLETSALVKLYVREEGTDEMLTLVQGGAGHRFAILALSRVEFRAAVRRRERLGDLSSQAANALIAQLARHCEATFQTQSVTDGVVEEASALLDRHALRAYDAIQLAGGLLLRGAAAPEVPVFACADQPLLAAARAEGLRVFDPTEDLPSVS